MLKEYLLENHREELEEILDSLDISGFYSIYIKWVMCTLEMSHKNDSW